ncbi:secretin N-terminal domain-containing protein [Roseibacillus persicicus]|uniref:secretin N-terminal domain-containing protein n=1 Tax=Roseibacillus persicicus TaxID=454148 RepID=UPI00398A77C4
MSISKYLVLSLAVSGFLAAQNPPRPALPPIPGIAGEEPEGDPLPQNATQLLSKPNPNDPFPGGLEFPTATAAELMYVYQSATGKRVLIPTALKDVQFSFMQAGGMTNREVAELLEQYLLLEGYQLNTSLRNPDIVTLLGANQQGGGPQTAEPVRIVTDPAQLALETGVVSYVMKFQYLKPEEAQRAFTQVFGQFRPGGTIAEVRNASSLIITEKANLIQALLKLKNEIDVPSAQVGTAWVEVEYADVQELADQLNEMFNAQQSQSNSARVQRQQATPNTPPIPGLANNAAGGGGDAGGEENPPTITPDSRTNRIFLMGRPVDLVFIKQLIEQWDVKTSDRNFLVRKLKYLPVYEFIPIAETAISSTLGDSAGTGGSATGGNNRSTSNANNRSLGNNNTNSNSRSTNSSSGFGGSSGGSVGTASLSGTDRPTQPESVLVGKTLLVSDNVANSIIVQGPPHHIELVENLIEKLDVKNEQVAISAVFGRYDVGSGISFGVDVAKLLDGNGVGFTSRNSTNSTGNIIDPASISSFANLAGGGSGLALQGISGDFGVFVNALETYTNLRTFARPTIFTTNNKEARISSGRQIAIPTSTFQSGTNGSLSSNVEYRDVALELLVRPLVNSSDEITLEISIVRDAISDTSSVQQTDLSIPDLFSDQLNTIVTVPNGSAVLLGGLIEDSENHGDSGIPVLKHIPVLGGLFRTNADSSARSELVIMIRPTIVDGEVAINQYQQVYDYSSNLSGDARKEFSAPRYGTNGRPVAQPVVRQEVPVAEPTHRRPMSPIQQAIYDKQMRAAKK